MFIDRHPIGCGHDGLNGLHFFGLCQIYPELYAIGSPCTRSIRLRAESSNSSAKCGCRSKVEYDLTPHETRLLKLLVEGNNYTTEAVELNVSYNTTKFHMLHIYEKLQVHSKSEAVA